MSNESREKISIKPLKERKTATENKYFRHELKPLTYEGVKGKQGPKWHRPMANEIQNYAHC